MALQGRWLREVRDQLPEGIFLLARSLRAGLSLEQAFASGRNFCPRPLIEVFGRIADQIELGRPAATAVQQMADSIVLPDLNTLASVLVLHNEVGGNLPVLLDRLAANIRDHNQFRGYYRAATTLSRVSAAFIAIAAPVLGLLLFLEQPELFLNFFRTGMGIFLFALAIIINLVGIVWLYLLLGRVQY
jgi:tight adherence protein B